MRTVVTLMSFWSMLTTSGKGPTACTYDFGFENETGGTSGIYAIVWGLQISSSEPKTVGDRFQ